MSDNQKSSDFIDGVCQQIAESDVESLISGMLPEMIDLLDHATHLFEQYHVSSQLVALAIMFGVACSSIEGEDVQIEKEKGILITFEERLKLFTAQTRMAYDEAMKARALPGAPQDPTKVRM